MTMYTFGEILAPIRRHDLHNFLADAKTHVEMNLLIEKAFATAAKAETSISIADAFGMVCSTPITFVTVLFKEYPVLKDRYTYSKQNGTTVIVRSKFWIDPDDMVLLLNA